MKLMLAQNIRTQRKAHSLTQENLAEAIGVTVGAVSKWENGTTSPDLVTLMGLADLFGTSVDALLGYQLGGHTVQSTVEELHTLQQKKSTRRARPKPKMPCSATIIISPLCGLRQISIIWRALNRTTPPGCAVRWNCRSGRYCCLNRIPIPASARRSSNARAPKFMTSWARAKRRWKF